jgi:hypothetical protein
MKIPVLPKTQLDALAAQIRPLVRGLDGNAYPIEPVDLNNVSYTWDPKLLPTPVTNLNSLGEFRCLHGYGHPSLFKPSIAEVLRQIPASMLEGATYFEMVKKPGNLDDMKEDREAMDAGFHVSTIRVYGK